MLNLSSKLLTLACLVSFALSAPTLQNTATKVIDDLNSIHTDLKKLSNDVAAFSGTLAQAATIHADGDNISKLEQDTLLDIKATQPFSENDGKAIFNLVSNAMPEIKSALDGLVAKKPAFDKIGASPIVKASLDDLKTNTEQMAEALKGKAPADQVAEATTLESQISAAFSAAQRAYA